MSYVGQHISKKGQRNASLLVNRRKEPFYKIVKDTNVETEVWQGVRAERKTYVQEEETNVRSTYCTCKQRDTVGEAERRANVQAYIWVFKSCEFPCFHINDATEISV
jgi:hypothetical protein